MFIGKIQIIAHEFPSDGSRKDEERPLFLRLPSTPCQKDNDRRCYSSQAMPIHQRHIRSLSKKLEYGIPGHGNHRVMTPSGSVYRPFGRQAKTNVVSPQQIPVMFSVGSDKLNNYGRSWRTNDV